MNYLQLLDENDIIKMLEKCNLRLSEMKNEPIAYCKDKSFALIFCQKINLDTKDKLVNNYIEEFQDYFPQTKDNYLLPYIQSIILYASSYELIDSFNNIDFSDILFETISSKLANNEKLSKKYKKDFIKFYNNLEKQDKEQISNDIKNK